MATVKQEELDTILGDPVLAEQLLSEVAEARRELARARQQAAYHLRIASQVHRSLLPRPVRNERVHVDFRYLPVETVGGDYCQVRFPDPSSCYITMCDVAGHGVGPSLLAARVSSEVRRLIIDCLSPCEIVRSLNWFVWECFRNAQPLLSFVAARIDLDDKSITYSGAGHPPVLHVCPTTNTVTPLISQNMVIGVARTCLQEEPEHTLPLKAGDRLVFHTDGITEAMNAQGGMLGRNGLADIALRCQSIDLFEMADTILEHVAMFRFGPPADDMTLVVAEMK